MTDEQQTDIERIRESYGLDRISAMFVQRSHDELFEGIGYFAINPDAWHRVDREFCIWAGYEQLRGWTNGYFSNKPDLDD